MDQPLKPENVSQNNQSFRLRKAREGDFPAIRRLVRQGSLNPFSLHWSRFWLVVDEEDQVLACGQVKTHSDGSQELASIVVDPAQRGKGFARLVIEQLLHENSTTLYLTCRGRLGPFYEKFGFEGIDLPEMPAYYRKISRFVNGLYKLRIAPDPMLVMRRHP
jgi:N-acetylglutamate synthase-like GNAT family acetyltransferase